MASTYVNDLRLNELGTGDGSGTWGTTTNTNLELIAEALSFGTEAISTNADTHTSTIADGSTDPARSIYIKYTGTLDSACTITIAPNTISRVHFIENGTSGSQNIIISQGSGSNVTIGPGDVKAVYLDGAGSGAAVVDAFASLAVGKLTAEADTSAGDNAAIGYTASEGLILTGQGSTSDITLKNDADGVVFSVPTGTDDILFPDGAKAMFGASSDLTITHDGSDSLITDSGTGNLQIRADDFFVMKQDGSEVMIRADTDSFVKLFHDGSEKLATSSSGISVTGEVAASTLDISGDIDVDGTANFDAVDIDGNVDIVNTATLTCGAIVSSISDHTNLTLTSTNADANAGPKIVLNRDSGSPADGDATGEIIFKADDDGGNSTEFAKIESSIIDASNTTEDGRLIVRTITAGTATSRLDFTNTETVFNDSSIDVDFRVESNGNANMIQVNAGDDYVGIGEASPNVTLHVTGPSGQIAIDTTSGGEPLLRFRENGSTRGLLKMDGSNNYQFHTGADGATAEVGRFDADGNFHVAGTSTTPGLGNTTTGIVLRADGIVSFSGASNYFNINRNGTGTIQQFNSSGNTKGSVTIASGGVTFNTTSDIRLKQDIEPLQATDKLMTMNPVSYNWKSDPDGPKSMGFIAQEMEEVMPEAVSTGNDGMMQMDYGRITPILVSALQDAHKKIEELESRIAAMESK